MTEFSAFWNGTTVGDATAAPYDANTEFANWVKRGFGIGANRANAGVVLGTGSESTQFEGLQVTANSPAGMSVLLNIGAAQVDGTEYYNDGALTLAIAANASGNARIDTVVLRKSWGAQTVISVVLQGTPAASPVPPTLTQSAGVTWEIPIADIAVANGAVSITASNITSRALYTSAADGVYLDRLNNNSGVTLQSGDLVGLDSSADRAVTATAATSLARLQRIGIWQGRNAAASVNGRALNRGICYVRTSAAVTRGQYVVVDIAASTCSGSTQQTLFSIGEFLETTSGAGLALAYIDAGLPDSFGRLGSTTLAAPAASLAITIPQSPYATLVCEYYLRTAVAATSELVNIRFQGTDVAGNFYSYLAQIANTAPAVTAVQNLAATVGIQIVAPGATATAGYFVFGRFEISHADNLEDGVHVFNGQYALQIANTNGNLYVGSFSGRYTRAIAITQMSFVSASGANMDTLSYVSVFAKDR